MNINFGQLFLKVQFCCIVLQSFYQNNFIEAGCDEAGRGCYAGPVFAAAVILKKNFFHPVLNDSKQLSEKQRNIITSKLKNDIQFSFLSDSAYQVLSGSEVINGRWWFSADKKTLFTTTQQKTVESKIYELKKKGFRFESAGDLNQSFLFTCSPIVTDKK